MDVHTIEIDPMGGIGPLKQGGPAKVGPITLLMGGKNLCRTPRGTALLQNKGMGNWPMDLEVEANTIPLCPGWQNPAP